MKITIEMNTNDIVSAKAELFNKALVAMLAQAAHSVEANASAAEAAKVAPAIKPAEPAVEATPDAEKSEAEKPVKAAEKRTAKKQTAKKAEPAVKAEEPAVEAEEEEVVEEPDKDMGEPKDIPEPAEEPKTEPIDRDALTTKLRDLVHADRSRSKAIKAILQKHGVTKVHELSDEDLASVVEEAEQL